MKRIVEGNTEDFLDSVFRLEGGNVERVDIRLNEDFILIEAYSEGAVVNCTIKLVGIQEFKIISPSEAEFFGLSGFRNSLEVVWRNSSVLVAIGANESSQDFVTLKNCNFYVQARELYADVQS
ncbi:hypothetical protein [Pleionea sediminis]|uniref:hypothetical protein n=1 Tax=Pleionea sediminis TaxID=2569479 RepID=UPI001186FC48|nr:hypothetical protein [Pleionea sediminis]